MCILARVMTAAVSHRWLLHGKQRIQYIMRSNIHPKEYRAVVFQDINNNWSFLTRSTATAEETIKWEDGNEYPLIKVHISSSSHPFFTGQEKLLDIEGRVDKFKARKEAADKARAARSASAKKQAVNKTKKDSKKADKQAVKVSQ